MVDEEPKMVDGGPKMVGDGPFSFLSLLEGSCAHHHTTHTHLLASLGPFMSEELIICWLQFILNSWVTVKVAGESVAWYKGLKVSDLRNS